MNFTMFSWISATICILYMLMNAESKQDDVIINLKNSGTDDVYHLTFSENMFEKLLTCMCSQHSLCKVLYHSFSASPTFVVDDVWNDKGNSVMNVPTIYYRCLQSSVDNFTACYRSWGPSSVLQTSNVSGSVGGCGQKCIALIWTDSSEGIEVSPALQQFFPDCSTPAMTSSPGQSSTVKTTQVSRRTTAKFQANRGIPTGFASYTSVPTSSSSHKFSEPAAGTNQAEDDDGVPIGIIVGAVAGVIVITIIIVIVVVVVWKRRNTEHKSSKYSSETGTLSTSSGHSKEQNNEKKQNAELHHVNIKPSTDTSKPQASRIGHQNTKSIDTNNTHNITHNSRPQQDDLDDIDDDFGYDTAHNTSPGTDDDFANDTETASQNSGTQQNRTSDDYGYAYAEDPSNENNTTDRLNPTVSSVVVTISENNNIKNSNDDYEDVFDDGEDGEIPGMDTTMISKNPKDNVTSPSKTPPSDAMEPEDEYAVVNKNRSAATGDNINNDISSNNGDGASASTTSESKDVYSKLHETERHITDPYDSLSHLNSSLNVGNQSDPAQKLHSANQSSPYELAQPIPDTSTNENGRAATEEFELAPVSSSAGRGENNVLHTDQKNQALQGKKQAKKLPYGPEDYAVVIKKKT